MAQNQFNGMTRVEITFCMNEDDARGVRVFSGLVKLTANKPNFVLEMNFVVKIVHSKKIQILCAEYTNLSSSSSSKVSMSDQTVAMKLNSKQREN